MMNEGAAAAREKDGRAGVFVTARAVPHCLSMGTDWYLIMVKKEPIKGTQLSETASFYKSCRKHLGHLESLQSNLVEHGTSVQKSVQSNWHIQAVYLLSTFHFWGK